MILSLNKILTMCMFLVSTTLIFSQSNQRDNKSISVNKLTTYIIERDLPGAGQMSDKELADVSKHANAVIDSMGQDIKWLESYVTDDKIYCKYKAKSEKLIKEHAKKGGFPITKITKLRNKISPATGQ